MNWFKRFLAAWMLVMLAATLQTTFAQQEDPTTNETVRVDVFERETCGHCIDQRAFFDDVLKTRNDIELVYHDIEKDPQAAKDFATLTALETIPKVTPTTIIDQIVIQGFGSADTTGKKLLQLIDAAKGKPQLSFEAFVEAGGSRDFQELGETCDENEGCEASNVLLVDIPFYGALDVGKYSLPVLSLILGFVDGFNPCAMWVLVMFLTILMEAGSRRRMFEMAGLFILAEAVMYYLILNVWMTAWDFVGLDRIVTPIVGVVALGAGGYFLYLFFKNDTTCNVGSLETKRKTSEKIRHYSTQPMTLLVALGILGLAFSVNIIEFACSVGIPQTFTKVLDINYLSWTGKQFYNALYIFMYMIDDLIVFALALYSFDKIGLTTAKYTQISHFIGGAIMVVLGVLMLFAPQLLVFS
ncbi:glutaredoxin [Candidatus Peregrinibacteria bacterium]|nr:MAG: glutaredoxin [Candidatus Peregrinibacteria bacterium]